MNKTTIIKPLSKSKYKKIRDSYFPAYHIKHGVLSNTNNINPVSPLSIDELFDN